MRANPLDIAKQFNLTGDIQGVSPLGQGLINDTFLVSTSPDPRTSVVLQRINANVFPNPLAIIQNIQTLNKHLTQRRNAHVKPVTLCFPTLYQTMSGAHFALDANGDYWRAISYIPDTYNIEALSDITQAHAIGAALAEFHTMLKDIEISSLHTTLPGFHIAPSYLAQYDQLLALNKNLPPLNEWMDCADAVQRGRHHCDVLERAKQSGELRLRPIHGDPKLDNFLFDRKSQKVISLIDLDTLQPGLIHYDIGDCIRSSCNSISESSQHIEDVQFNIDLCRSLLQGYYDAASAMIEIPDIKYFYDAIRLIPWELGLRFLADHLAGDLYFKVKQRGANLHRARVQFKLVEEIERQRADILDVTDQLCLLKKGSIARA